VESQPPPIKERCQSIPTDLAELIMSALSKKTAERPATATSFAIALRLAVEGDKPLLNLADVIYRENRLKLLAVATLIYSPMIAANIFLLMLSHWSIFLYLPTILFANSFNNAFCSIAVNRLLNDRSFQIKPLLVSLIKKIGAISSTSITSGLKSLTKLNFFSLQPYAKYILHVPITTLEGESKNRALYHSTVLSKRISAIVSSLLFYEIALALMTIAMTQLLLWWFYWSHNATLTSLLSQGTGIIFTLVPVYLCPLIMSVGYSFYAIANTVVYFKAKQINNELSNKESLLSLSDTAATSSREIKLQYLLVLIFKALVTFTAIVCITALVAVVAHKLGLPTGSFKIE
ncbi:MAG: hypothetical protein JNN15_16430, partial [Blastocatellia bacterium]|nr:hypothetical protein [Blastocatellia bacterium]